MPPPTFSLSLPALPHCRIAALVVRQFATGVGDGPTDDRHLIAPVDLLPERLLEACRGSAGAVSGQWGGQGEGRGEQKAVG